MIELLRSIKHASTEPFKVAIRFTDNNAVGEKFELLEVSETGIAVRSWHNSLDFYPWHRISQVAIPAHEAEKYKEIISAP